MNACCLVLSLDLLMSIHNLTLKLMVCSPAALLAILSVAPHLCMYVCMYILARACAYAYPITQIFSLSHGKDGLNDLPESSVFQ